MSLERYQLLKHHKYSVPINYLLPIVFLGTYKVAIKCSKIKKLTLSVLFCSVTNNIQFKTEWL